jgi:hypothetical protein
VGRCIAELAVLIALGANGSAAERADEPRPLPASVRHALAELRGKAVVAHAKVLADPRFRGRQASSPDARKAAAYIATQFRRLGLRPGGGAGSYYQSFKIRLGYQVSAELELRLGAATIARPKLGADFMPVHLPGGTAAFSGTCVLAGYGITSPGLKFDEYAGLNATGKAVVAFSGVPWGGQAAAWVRRADPRPLDSLAYKAANAAEHGARLLVVVDDPAGWRKRVRVPERLRVPDTALVAGAKIPVVHVTREFVADLTKMSIDELRLMAVDIAREGKPESMPLRGRTIELRASLAGQARIGRNVVGVLPGRDEKLRQEAVVLGAHYDHLGELGPAIFFGANDNAAGVGSLIEVAAAFRRVPQGPRRTVVFVAFDAEEIGKLGSRNYVQKPAVPMDRTALMINFDMIGRNEPNDINAVGTRSSPDLHSIHQAMNRHVGLTLTHPISFRLGRSDHTHFYYAGVPILYFFGGFDPDYNTPRDTWDKLIPGKVEKVSRLAFLTALEVATRDARPRFERRHDEPRLRPPGRRMPDSLPLVPHPE